MVLNTIVNNNTATQLRNQAVQQAIQHPIIQQTLGSVEAAKQYLSTQLNPAFGQTRTPEPDQRPYNQVCLIDFGVIASQTQFGFGIQSLDIEGAALKDVQQTRGVREPGGRIKNNIYVDTWSRQAETITLAGVIELPFAYKAEMYSDVVRDNCTLFFSDGNVSLDPYFIGPILPTPVTMSLSFYDIMEQLFEWDSDPARVNAGWQLILYDYYLNRKYTVSFINSKWSANTRQQSLLNFTFEFRIIGTESI